MIEAENNKMVGKAPETKQTRGESVLIQWRVSPNVKKFIDGRIQAGGYQNRRKYLFDLLRKDGMDLNVRDL